jgi:hypothetical protein
MREPPGEQDYDALSSRHLRRPLFRPSQALTWETARQQELLTDANSTPMSVQGASSFRDESAIDHPLRFINFGHVSGIYKFATFFLERTWDGHGSGCGTQARIRSAESPAKMLGSGGPGRI